MILALASDMSQVSSTSFASEGARSQSLCCSAIRILSRPGEKHMTTGNRHASQPNVWTTLVPAKAKNRTEDQKVFERKSSQ